MKKILFLLAFAALLLPDPSHAQVDQRCWYRDDCIGARKELNSALTPEELEKGFITDGTAKELCKNIYQTEQNPIGFCLPPTNAKINISIGGQNEFTGLAEFVAFIYKYGLGLASLLAVLVMIFAGVQWIISGGNAEAISSAKHKISGAVIGLVILASAYTILYTINPDLVNLRPPNAWMINAFNIPTTPSCQSLKTNEKISQSPANKTSEKIQKEEREKRFNSNITWVSPTTTQANAAPPNAPPAHCGQDYFVQGTAALTCTGTYCPTGQACADFKLGEGSKCYNVSIAGSVYNTKWDDNLLEGSEIGAIIANWVLGRQGWSFPWITYADSLLGRAPIILYVVCEDGESIRVGDEQSTIIDLPEQTQTYWALFNPKEIDDANTNECKGSSGGVKGFVIAPVFNEAGVVETGERHFIGRTKPANQEKKYIAKDLGDVANAAGDLDNNCILKQAPKDNFFTAMELKQSFTLDINARYIADINDDNDRINAYKDFLNPNECR